MEISVAAAGKGTPGSKQHIAIKVAIENDLGECDGIEDCTPEKILRSPEHDFCSI